MALRLNTPHTRAAAGQVSAAVGVCVIALLLALVTRFAALDRRVMHTDEAVQAEMYLSPMLDGTGYTYHAADGHGPLLVYSTRLLCWLTGVSSPAELSEILLRATPALYSLGLVLLIALMADGLGRGATCWAMLFTALAPMLVFYSRYYIMEVPLVFMSTLAIAAGWRYAVSRHPGWILLAGAAVGLMHVTKETFVIPLLAGGLAAAATYGIEFFLSGTGFGQITRRSSRGESSIALPLVMAAVVAGAVSFVVFSGFFSRPGQFFDSLKAYVDYAKRAEGAGHEKPWWWYLSLLWGRRDADGFLVGEWPLVVLAAVGAGKAFFAPPTRYENVRLQRFLALYAIALICGYSMIAYKTPWCLLGAEHAIVLLAGIGASTLLSIPWGGIYRFFIWVGLVGTAGYLGVQLWRQNYQSPADPARNPYVYAHTSPDVLRLVRQVREAAASRGGSPKEFKVFIIHPESGHPLPWYFRDLGGGATTEMPEDSALLTQADVIITVPEAAALLGALVSSTHREVQETWMLRPGAPLRALFRRSLLGDLPKPAAAAAEQSAPSAPNPPSDTPPPAAPPEDPVDTDTGAPATATPDPPSEGVESPETESEDTTPSSETVPDPEASPTPGDPSTPSASSATRSAPNA